MRTIIDKVSSANSLGEYLGDVTVKIVHETNAVVAFMSPDRTLFISVAALELADTEEALALLVTHEMGHYLLDH